jgi:hypothetical protein
MEYQCPVCGYAHLSRPPEEFLICPSCGTEFGYDDAAPDWQPSSIYRRLRAQWISDGMPWFSHAIAPPDGWDPYVQLRRAGLITPFATVGATSTNVNAGRFAIPRVIPRETRQTPVFADLESVA